MAKRSMTARYRQCYAMANEVFHWPELELAKTAHKNVEAGLGQAGL